MKLFVVKNSNNTLVAYHEDLDVVNEYISNVKVSHPDTDLIVGKMSEKYIKKKDPKHDLYLVRYSETYVQTGYVSYLEIESSQYIYDMRYVKEIIIRTIDQWKDDLNDKDIKHLKKTAKIFDDILFDAESFTPTLDELKGMQDHLESYMYNRNTYYG